MSISIKTNTEITKMRNVGKLAASVLDMIEPFIRTGITTDELNTICHNYIVNDINCIPAPLNYGTPPFPKSICTSINNVVCHGIPSAKKLKKGDIMNIDITVIKDGYHGDTSRMFTIGKTSIKAAKICRVAKECLELGISIIKPGIHLGNVGRIIEKHAKKNNCSVVRDYCGHGIGKNFHEQPQVLHYDDDNIEQSPILESGMTFTIEPMINLGNFMVKLSSQDSWTVTTKDRSLSAQWEHTILVTNNSCDVLTK